MIIDTELLRRHDKPGPRYTSYPTAPQFGPSFGAEQLRTVIAQSNEGENPRKLSLYVHVPYCNSPCFYCGCNRIITRDHSRAQPYVDRLLKEFDAIAPLFEDHREVVQLHFGGGTPNFLTPQQLADVVDALRARFHFSDSDDRDISIELDPRFVTPDEIGELAAIGFNRASLGVQDFDPAVQEAVNRIQSFEMTRDVVEACRKHGMQSVNLDLIYGLPLQTVEGFSRTLEQVLELRPDRLAVYGYAHMPELFRPQRQLNAFDLPKPEVRIALLQKSIERLTEAGYQYIGMDHFALPDDSLAKAQRDGTLHRNFMGYTTHAESDLVGFGVSSISHIGPSFSQNPRTLPEYEGAIDDDRMPVWRGMHLNDDDLLRADVIQQLMCMGRIDKHDIASRHKIDFDTYFAESLAKLEPLRDEGLVELQPDAVVATEKGRFLLRILAMCFDAYLGAKAGAETPRFSKAI